jgi:DNA polymerase bacteriophage-type
MPADSSQIEARTLNWLAMQDDILDIFRAWDEGVGPDIYCITATRFFQREITPEDKMERQLGKVTELSCGYQSGGERFRETARIEGKLKLDLSTAQKAVDLYRNTHPRVVNLWKRAQSAMATLAGAEGEAYLDPRKLLWVGKGEIRLPNGFSLRYPDMQYDKEKDSWTYQGKRARRHIYGGKIVAAATQALARVINMDQTMQIRKRFKVVMHSHDEPVLLVPVGQIEEAKEYAIACLRTRPSWAPDIPLNAKVGWDRRYGSAKN